MRTPGGVTLTLLDVVRAVYEASGSSEEAVSAVDHLLSTGQVQFRDPPALPLRVDTQGIL